ncbi:hypothetical protein DXG01_003103 [Tephrocybe rancida]|nr:hypothetical protein DXG01_003103 [Tephrocybe rancida]
MSLMPGHSQPLVRPNFHFTDPSRRMTIANDIRNAHNIPLVSPPPVPPPPLPPYPPQAAAEFHPRPPPPLPASTPPPPRPPLPPSLTASRPAYRTSIPPVIPPKPFAVPFELHGETRPQLAVSVPRALLPGGQPTRSDSDNGDIAMAMALSASVANDELSQRQKLDSQEEDDFAKALEASMRETRNFDRCRTLFDNDVFAASSSDLNQSPPSTLQSAPSSHSQGSDNYDDEAFARSLAISTSQSSETPYNGASGSGPPRGTSSASRESACDDDIFPRNDTAGKEDSPLTSTPEQSPQSIDRELPGYSPQDVHGLPDTPIAAPRAADFILPTQGSHALNFAATPTDRTPRTPSPSTPSDLAYLDSREHDGDMTPRAERLPLARHPNSFTAASSTTYPWLLPETDMDRASSVPVPSASSGNTFGRPVVSPDAALVNLASFKEAFPDPATLPEPPKYSPQSGPNEELPSTSQRDPAHAQPGVTTGDHHATPVAGPSKGDVTPPSYYEISAGPAEGSSNRDQTDASGLPFAPTRNAAHPQSRPSSSKSASPSLDHHLSSTALRVDTRTTSPTVPLSRASSASSSSDDYSDDLDSARPSASAVNLNAFVNKELFIGVSVGFKAPMISEQLKVMEEDMPPIISLPYGKARPLHLQGPSWRHMLKLMASLSGTQMHPSVDALAVTKTQPKLRTVVQFVKPHRDSPTWRTIFYFTIDYPSPQPQPRHRSVNDLPYSYSLAGAPTLLRDAADSSISKTYTIPATDLVPFPTLPISFPKLAMYMQAALDDSRRYVNDSHSDYRKLARMITVCYPDEDLTNVPTERRGLFQRVIGRSNKAPRRGGNEDTYELVTPFVPDEWG